jgi:ABC-2 type transport system ATP-binding protein
MSTASANGEVVVQAIGLSMSFGPVRALDNVTFSVHKGEILGLLGRNGAGKTTTMRILTTYLVPGAGTARVAGFDVLDKPNEVRRRIGYLPETVPVYADMEVRDYLRFVGRGRGLSVSALASRLDWVVQQCDIAAVFRRPIGELSKGFRQRVAMAQALIHDPEILILDEPTSGLDPVQIRTVRNLIRELSRTKTILFSTHILQEIEAMTRRMLVIDGGRLVADGTAEELYRRTGMTTRVVALIEAEPAREVEVVDALAKIPGVREARRVDTDRPQTLSFEIRSEPGERVIPGVIEQAAHAGWRIVDLRVSDPTLEEAFTALLAGVEAG